MNTSTRSKQEVDRWCDDFESLCRARGIRVTPQRLAVYRVLAEDRSHPKPESVYRRVRERVPGLSQATVYRILEFLEREKLIKRVSADDGVGHFDANLASHQHLVCRVCGRMIDVSVPALTNARVPSVTGFAAEELDIRIVGRCRQCARLKAGRRKPLEPSDPD
jgi:Fur family peroxide stress response transcriptional regulator